MNRRTTIAAVATLLLLSAACKVSDQGRAEERARAELAWSIARDSGNVEALGISSRPDVRFEWGTGPIEYEPQGKWRAHAFRWIGQRMLVRLRTIDGHPMTLGIAGWVDVPQLRMVPTVTLYIDGQLLARQLPTEEGQFTIETTVRAEMTRGRPWVDLMVELSSVAYHWLDPPELKAAVLTALWWRPEQL